MSLSLYVDGARWRAQLRSSHERDPGLVPVVKGNGYGFGNARLARRAQWLGVDTVAVGTYSEVAGVLSRFDGRVLVLTPWRPTGQQVPDLRPAEARRVVHTVGRLADLDALSGAAHRPKIVLERLTSMRRHGLSAADLRTAATRLGGVRLEGVALHLPLLSPRRSSHLAEVEQLLTDVVAADLPTRTVYLSHLTLAELRRLRATHPDLSLRPRVGTALWLGDRAALSARATVLDVHPVERGDVFGYRGRRAPGRGAILVVAGGTAHGIGLEAPHASASLRQRAAVLARGGLDAAGLVRSPYTVDGRQRFFAEPPHMQVSMLFVPNGATLPSVGEEVTVAVRFTATSFDAVVVD